MFLIAMHNRVGSTWLCSMLNSTGLNCREYLNGPDWELQLSNNIKLWNNKVGLKNTVGTLQKAISIIGEKPFSNIKTIWLRRNNILAAAISNYRAEYSKIWSVSSVDGVDKYYSKPIIPFNKERIMMYYNRYKYVDMIEWPKMFKKLSITPLEVYYEDMCQSPSITSHKCLEYLGFNGLFNIKTDQFIKDPESDRIVQEWGKLLC